MSTQNVYDKLNAPTNEVLSKYFQKTSMDLLKKKRFDFGKGPSGDKMREMLRLDRFVCNNICYLDSESTSKIRELVIKNSILKLDGM